MARKVIGPTGSRRRRWLFLCTSFAAIAIAVVFIPSALAVHDLHFQLDGDTTSHGVQLAYAQSRRRIRLEQHLQRDEQRSRAAGNGRYANGLE